MKILLLCDEGIDWMKELMGHYFLGLFKFIDGPAHSCSAVVDTSFRVDKMHSTLSAAYICLSDVSPCSNMAHPTILRGKGAVHMGKSLRSCNHCMA